MAKDSEKQPKKEEKPEDKNDAEVQDDDNEEEEQKTATAAKTAKDMSNVTRYINGEQEGQGVDEDKLSKAIGKMSKANSSRAAATTSTHVKLQKEDIELVVGIKSSLMFQLILADQRARSI